VWLVWAYNASVRLRFNLIRGDNEVVSAIAFDALSQQQWQALTQR
jgi:hypothetical protein